MQGYIWNTPFYTKIDWHTGKSILSRNGQTPGFGRPGTMRFDRRVTFGVAGHAAAGVTGTTTYHGKRIGRNAIAVMNNPKAQQSFGGAERKAQDRRAKIEATGRKLDNLRGKVRGGNYTELEQQAAAVNQGQFAPYEH